MANPIYPGIAGAPGYTGTPGGGGGPSASPPPSTPPPSDGGGGSVPPTDTTDTPPVDTGGSGLISVDGSDGGINVDAVDTNGDDSGLIDVHSDAPGGLVDDALDGTHIDIVNPDSLIDAHVPGVLDATAGDGTVSDLVGGVTSGDGIGDIGNLGSLGNLTDALQGIEVNALQDGNLLEAHAPDLVDATVGGGTDLGGLLGSIDSIGGTGDLIGGVDGITVEALNGENIAEAHAGNLVDATVGEGQELGGLLGAISDTAGGATQSTGELQGLNVEALNGDYIAEAHAPGTLDATVGGAELGNLIGGAELGGLLGGLDVPLDGGGLLGDFLNVGSGGDLAGLDLGHTLDSITG